MNKIKEFFEMEVVDQDVEFELTPVIQHDNVKDNTKDDYHQSRESLKTMIEKGTQMVDALARVAQESESPRAFEVMGSYLKQLAEMNKMLLELNKQAKTLLEEDEDNENSGASKKYAFIGSTEDLQDFIEGLDK